MGIQDRHVHDVGRDLRGHYLGADGLEGKGP